LPRSLKVALSTGDGFGPFETWAQADDIDFTFDENWVRGALKNWSARDVNGDGLADIIFTQGLERYGDHLPQKGQVLFSDGTKFMRVDGMAGDGSSTSFVPNYTGTGDFNGDGLLDFMSFNPSANAQGIIFATNNIPNTLVAIEDGVGGRTEVAYAPSSDGYGNDAVVMGDTIPGVRQIVASITRKNGQGDARTTEYRFRNSHYDYDRRKSLGFEVVRGAMPKSW